MTYGEIKIEALKIMFLNGQDPINEDWLSAYKDDETYRSYLENIKGSLNRCLSTIEEKRILPSRQKKLSAEMGTASGAFIRFDLPTLIEDYFDLDRVAMECGSDYASDCDYIREGNVLVLPRFHADQEISYYAVYKPKIKRITFSTADTDEIDLPEGIAAYVPYYLKGELFRDDEPNEAADAMNQFEQRMNEISKHNVSRQTSVRSIYSQTEW